VDVLELAWHVSESAQPGDEAALDVLTEAANRARVSAPERSASLCARALELAADDDRRGALLALRCRALFRASRPDAAAEAGQAALALLPAGADRARTAITVLSSLHLTSRLAEALELADAEISAGGAPAALHAQRAMLLAFSRRTGEAAAQAELTASLPTASTAEAVIVDGHLAMVWSLLARHDRTVSYVDRAVSAAARNPALELQALAVGASTEALAALVPQAAAHLGRAAAAGGHAFRAEILVSRIALDWLGGRWGAALEGIPAAVAELHVGQHRSLADALTAIELDIRSWRGELGVAQRLVERPASPLPNMANMRAVALVGYQLARGEIDAARATIDAAVYGEGWQGPSDPPYACVLLGQRAELELEHGSPDVAAEVLATLVEVATGRFSPWSISTLHRTVGRVSGDADALRHAITAARAGGLVLEEARAQLALGEVDPGGLDELVAAYLVFQELGADTLRRRAGRRIRELGGKVPRVRSRPRGLLTEAEEKIARLVQQGMRNREIAAALNYSPRSVEVYLSRIYAKLRISSRLELARTLDARRADDG
jgi:DNA-binding CsgD family transcriptional regulator